MFQCRLFIVILLLLVIPIHYAQEDYSKYYSDCRNQNASICGIRPEVNVYPFWGGDVPSYCGVEGFELTCQNHSIVIDIGGESKFNLVTVSLDHSIVLNRTGDLLEDTCAPKLTSTILNTTIFHYSQATVDLYMFYNCPLELHIPVKFGIRNSFSCKSGDKETKQVIFGEKSHLEEYLETLYRSCKVPIRVPVDAVALQKFANNQMMPPDALLEPTFEIQYRIMETSCYDCRRSSGVCWKGTNLGDPTCLYENGTSLYLYSNSGKSRDLTLKIGVVSGVTGVGILVLLLFFLCYRWIKAHNRSSHMLSKNVSSYPKDVEAFIRQYGSSTPNRFRYSSLRKITNSFTDELGKGGYGNVFKGSLPDGRLVAVKILNVTKGNGEEFMNEVASIGRTSHVNVVTLLGFCYEGNKRALIYEFMPNGSLEKFIYGKIPSTEGQQLGCKKLYSIALGIARGLEYLHRGCNTQILHFDIKPHNILLDEDFCPKISDFGLAKLYTRKLESVVSSVVEARGTIGYIAPEVFSRTFGQVSHKSDVYSYGMMILEMVGGRKNVNTRADRTSEIYYPYWLYKHVAFSEELCFGSEISKEETEIVRKMVIVGLWCIQTSPLQRPSISEAIEMLEGHIAGLKIPPKPYLCSPPCSPSNSQPKSLIIASPITESNSAQETVSRSITS